MKNVFYINLLPLEFREQNLKNAKFLKIQSVGVGAILLIFFLTSLTIALRILQSQNLKSIQNQLTQSEEKVSQLKTTQASLFILKNRLTTIGQYLGTSSNPTQTYSLITKLLPPFVTVNSISIDNSAEILVLLTVPNGESLDSLVTSLTSNESNEGRIAQVSLENINRGKDGVYRASIKIKTKPQ